MTSVSALCLVTSRDLDLFEALDRCPLTVRQILKLSVVFAYPFTTERRVQERLQALCAAGRVRQWWYTTAGRGALSYYTLAPRGYRLLHGHDAVGRGPGPVGVARQAHTRALAEAIVHLAVAAHRAGIPIENFRRENALRLSVGEESLYPDSAFELAPDPEARLSYFIEIDNRSESVRSTSSPDSWEKKVQFYERYRDAQAERFRVLVVTTGGRERLGNMLRCAAEKARNPLRSLVYGATLQDFLKADAPLLSDIFRDHQGQNIALIPAYILQNRLSSWNPLQGEPALVGSSACPRPFAEV